MLRNAFLISMATALLIISVIACGQINAPMPDSPTKVPATPTSTPTPTPSPTPTATPTPATPPTATPEPAADLGPITDFMVQLNGFSVEGSFKMGEESVTFSYRPDKVDAAEEGLRVDGTLSYNFLDHAKALPELGGLLTPVGDTCDKLGFTTDSIEIPQFDITIPSQQLNLDLSLLDGTNARTIAEMVCRATRMVVEQPDGLLTKLLLGQINRLLSQ